MQRRITSYSVGIVTAIALAAIGLVLLFFVPSQLAYAANNGIQATGSGGLKAEGTKSVEAAPATVAMQRVYNPNSGEHFYTANVNERKHLVSLGWRYEGTGWVAPKSSSAPVYRLYNPYAGEHHYTTNAKERDHLKSVGWRYEGIGWYSADSGSRVALYREYNPNAYANNHNFTTSAPEHNNLVRVGWRAEGAAWFGVAQAADFQNGWINENGAWRYYRSGVKQGGWVVTDRPPAFAAIGGGMHRYWFDKTGALAVSRLINPSAVKDKGAGYLAYATGGGYVVCGKYDTGKGLVYVADSDGRLPTTSGWLVTAKYDGVMQRYYIDGASHAARTGYFKVGGAAYWGESGQGYVARNRLVVANGTWYQANNDGVLSPDSVTNRLIAMAQGYSSPSNYLIMVDIDNPRTVVLEGFQGNWRPKFVWNCCTGKPETPTIQGVFSIGAKGYSFGEWNGYSCYWYSSFCGDYLFHTAMYYPNTHVLKDGRMGIRSTGGCVRLADDAAKWIYDCAPGGTTVVTTY